jgi:hypothetical protein
MNDYQFKLVKIKGEFTWHQHAHTDETFYAQAWVVVKLKWGLMADHRELNALRELLGDQVELPLEATEMNRTATVRANKSALPSAVLSVVCGSKRYCRDLRTCEKARTLLNQCRLSRLDGDKDGVLCEALCD